MARDETLARDRTRIFLRPIASGLPLGFFSFGVGMLMLGSLAMGWIPAGESKQVGLIITTFVFPLELVATIFAFLARDTMGATTIGLFTTSWLTFGLSDLIAKPGSTSAALGVYLFGFASAAFLLAMMAFLAKPFFTVLLLVAAGRMVLSGLYEVGLSHILYTIAGYFGLALTVLAFYGAVGFALEDGKQREVLPLFRRGAADEAFNGFDGQLERLEAEAGVRQQL